jgi:3-oxoadipate enol-lactonase
VHREYELALADHRTSVCESGSGDATLLLHSSGLTGRAWSGLLPLLADRGRTIAYDLRMHGTAATAPPETFSIAACARDGATVLDQLGIEAARVVGSSIGGAIGLQLALDHPGRVTELTIVGSRARYDPDVMRQRIADIREHGMASQIEATLARWFSPAALATSSPGVTWVRAQLARVPDAVWLRLWETLAALDLIDQIEQIAVPVIVVAPEFDHNPRPALREVAERIPGARFAVLDGAFHLVNVEAPAALLPLLG